MPGRYLLGTVILATTLWISCGGGTGTSQNSSGSSTRATLTVGANTLDFGSVSVGGGKTNSLALSNAPSGGTSITVTQIKVTGAGFSLSSAPALPLVVAAGESVTLAVRFAPKSAGSVSGNLSVECDAADPNPTVSLSGSGLAAGQLAVSPPTINFGSVVMGNSNAQTGTLTASDFSITVSSAGWNGQGYSVSGITFPATIPAGQSVSFTVAFAPQTTGSSSGSISFVSNALNSPSTQTFTGTGTQPTQHSVSLSWSPSTSQVTGYNVYRGIHTGGPYTKLNSSSQPGISYIDNSVQSGLTYFYVATSVDSNSVESSYSNQTSAVIPTP